VLVDKKNVLQSALQYTFEHFISQVNLAEQLYQLRFWSKHWINTSMNQDYWGNSKWYFVNVERSNSADELQPGNINIRFNIIKTL
jgi:hypothetical protein